MKLKKVFKKRASENDPLILDYIALIDTGTTPEQNWSNRFITEGLKNKWLEFIGDKTILLHVSPETLRYDIKFAPGIYCCHCNQELVSGNEHAKVHVLEKHNGVESPDRNNPSGYRYVHGYECILDKSQHEKFKAVPGKAMKPFYRKAA